MPTLTLRPRSEKDFSVLWRWIYAEEHPEWQLWDGPYFPKPPRQPYADYLEKVSAQPPNPDQQIIALDGQCIGTVTRYEEDPEGAGWWELGLVIYDPQFWSGGYGTQALRLWTAKTFAETSAHVITLTTWGGNQRMIRAAQRVGYRECARIPEARLWQGQRWDSVKLAVLRHKCQTAPVSLHIRPAQMFDAAFAAPLIAQTIGSVGWTLTGTDNDEDAAHVIAQFFAERGNRLSFTQTLIAEEEGRPVGLAVLYAGELAHSLDEAFREHRRMLGLSPEIVSEGQAGELYLDTLALIPEVRGKGYGGQFLDACAQKATQMGLPLTLLVEDGNPAERLYTRSGFVPAEKVRFSGHEYTRMVRKQGAI